jgi:hypothetical protein
MLVIHVLVMTFNTTMNIKYILTDVSSKSFYIYSYEFDLGKRTVLLYSQQLGPGLTELNVITVEKRRIIHLSEVWASPCMANLLLSLDSFWFIVKFSGIKLRH